MFNHDESQVDYLGYKVLFIMNNGQTYIHTITHTHTHTHTHTRKFNLWFSPFYELTNNAIQRLLMVLNAGYIPICNKQQTQGTEGQSKMIKKLEGASIGEAKRIIQNQFNDISLILSLFKYVLSIY